MKTKILLLISLFLSISCNPLNALDQDQFGFDIRVKNNTTIEYENASITIGGMRDGEFIGTESFNLPNLEAIGPKSWSHAYGGDTQFIAIIHNNSNSRTGYSRWNPDLDLIRNIPSEKIYFKLTLEKGNEMLLRNINESGIFTDLVNRTIPEDYVIKNEDGNLSIVIREDLVYAQLYEN